MEYPMKQLWSGRKPENFWQLHDLSENPWFWTALGVHYSLGTSWWIWGVLPTEWLNIPTWPKGFLLVLAAWVIVGVTGAAPFAVWGWSRCRMKPSLRPWIVPLLVAFAWKLNPLCLLEPGYFLAFTQLDTLARWGGVFTLTWLVCFVAEACFQPQYLVALLVPLLMSFWPSEVQHRIPQKIYVLQQTSQRKLIPDPASAVRLLRSTPEGAFVVLPEGIFRPGTRPANWEKLIAHRTVVWGEIRFVDGTLRNSLIAHNATGETFIYDKQHLVPGVEWLGPPGIDRLLYALTGWIPYSAGNDKGIWHSPYGAVSVGVCFDIGWPVKSGSQFGLILSNEDWLGTAFPLWQNQVQRVRTIENGSEIIKVTNRGAVYAFP
jgi:hypothetical protein